MVSERSVYVVKIAVFQYIDIMPVQYKFEVALNTVLQMKTFNDSVLDDLEEALKRVFLDWGVSKMKALRISGGSDDEDAFGGASEQKIAKLYNKLNEAETMNETYEQQIVKLKEELEAAKRNIDTLSPLAKRADELQERNNILSKSLKETNEILGELDIAHNALQEKQGQLEVRC